MVTVAVGVWLGVLVSPGVNVWLGVGGIGDSVGDDVLVAAAVSVCVGVQFWVGVRVGVDGIAVGEADWRVGRSFWANTAAVGCVTVALGRTASVGMAVGVGDAVQALTISSARLNKEAALSNERSQRPSYATFLILVPIGFCDR